jgi:peptide/nickel transport system substrate-binding protein
VVERAGGLTSQRVTCQILPPNFQGYEPFCPFTLDPESGVWSAPDLDRARVLIEEADAAGEKVTAWVTDDPRFEREVAEGVKIMRHVVDVLNKLGLHAELKIVHNGDEYFGAIYGPQPGSKRYRQVYLGAWGQTCPGAGGFIDDDFRCSLPGLAPILCTDSLGAKSMMRSSSRRPIPRPRTARGSISSTSSSRTPCGPL